MESHGKSNFLAKKVEKYLRSLLFAWEDFLYPSFCLYCQKKLFFGEKVFCSPCWEQSHIALPLYRCLHCFAEAEASLCSTCKLGSKYWFSAYVFEYGGPILALSQEIVKHRRWDLGVAALFTYQLCRLPWPIPDKVVLPRKKELLTISKQVAKNLQVPYVSASDLSQSLGNYLLLSVGKEEENPLFLANRKSQMYFLSFVGAP